MVGYSPLSFPRSFDRSQIKSISLLALSLIPLCGCIIAITLRLSGDSKRDKFLHFTFKIPNRHWLNNALTIIGVFHAIVGYCIRNLMSRVATQFRTRAFLNKSTSTAQLLNTLPGSPDWKILFKSRFAWILFGVGLFSGGLSIGGGILYKQGIILSNIKYENQTTCDQFFITNCTAQFADCVTSRYFSYGRGIAEARGGGLFTKGVEKLSDSARILTFVSAPKLDMNQLMSPTTNITKINAKTFAMVANYSNATPDQIPKEIRISSDVADGQRSIHLMFHGVDDIDWSFSFNKSVLETQVVLGMTRYCVADCSWSKIDDQLTLDTCNNANCSSLRLAGWSNLGGTEIAHALFSEIRDQRSEQVVLNSAYVVPAMYAAIVLSLGNELLKDPLLNSSLSGRLNCTQHFTLLVIESNKHFVAYVALLFVIFIAHWISGFVDKKVFVSEWGPLWFGILTDSEQEDIREQIRISWGLEGLEEIGSKSIPVTPDGLEEIPLT